MVNSSSAGRVPSSSPEGEIMSRYPRVCEVCSFAWKSRPDWIWIVLCPKCKISGYHIPASPPVAGTQQEK